MAEQERWAPKVGQSYYYVSFFHEVPTASIGLREEDPFDDLKIKQLNCYQTYVEAQAAADEMRKVLLRHAGKLHDFTWAVAEMKKGNKVIRASDKGRFGDFHCNVENCIYLKGGQFINDIDLDPTVFDLDQMDATDWEIYSEE